MSRKHCKRKHYALTDPIALATKGAFITDTVLLDKLRLIELAALQAWTDGAATPDDWRTFADVVNLTQTLAGMGVGPEALVSAQRAEAALLRAHGRYAIGLPMTASQTDVKTFRDVYEYHDLQRTSIDRSTYERAIVATMGKIRGAGPAIRVCVGREEVTA